MPIIIPTVIRLARISTITLYVLCLMSIACCPAVEAAISRLLDQGAQRCAMEESRPPAEDSSSDSGESSISLPFVGTIDTSRLSLPVLTVVIGLLDSFNPCAFFVLLFLLSLLVHAHSRQRMVIVGGVFVFASGLLYFLFMAAWLNFFLLLGRLKTITTIAGVVALAIGAVNIKDFFFFERGISLVIPEQAKPRLFERMREIVHAGRLPAMLAATIFLALAANSYEVICTAGFPMVYTRALTLQPLPLPLYYLYLALYNVVYVIPLACIVTVFAVTLGSHKLSEWHGRILKLLSGVMMLCLGIIILAEPALLTNALISAGLLLLSIGMTAVVVMVAKHFNMDSVHREQK